MIALTARNARRPLPAIRSDIQAAKVRLEALCREEKEARGKRRSAAVLSVIAGHWQCGLPRPEILQRHGLTVGQLMGMVHQHGWKRPFKPPTPMRELDAGARRLYRKLRKCGLDREAAWREASRPAS